MGDFTDDIYIRMQRCWATPTEQSDSDTSFELIDTGCGTEDASNQGNFRFLLTLLILMSALISILILMLLMNVVLILYCPYLTLT